MIPSSIERMIADIVESTNEATENYRYDGDDLYWHLGNLARRAMEAGRLDEIERIQKNTLDADSDVWSHDDYGNLMSLTERQKALS